MVMLKYLKFMSTKCEVTTRYGSIAAEDQPSVVILFFELDSFNFFSTFGFNSLYIVRTNSFKVLLSGKTYFGSNALQNLRNALLLTI